MNEFGGLGRKRRSAEVSHLISRRDVTSELSGNQGTPVKPVPIRNLNLTMFVRDTAWDFMPSGN